MATQPVIPTDNADSTTACNNDSGPTTTTTIAPPVPPPSPPHSDAVSTPEKPYHILDKRKKWYLVYMVSMAGMLSPLASNIYFPAIDSISDDLMVDDSLVALSVTIYMIVQGLAPSFWSPLADSKYGRRIALMATLSVFALANIGLCLTQNFPMLMAFRGLQAAGSAATISIGTGVIADIALPSERGGFIGVNSGIRMFAQALGPSIGGILNGIWGYRSVFWFLFVVGSLILMSLIVFLPETQRSIAGNGSIPLHGIHRPLIYIYSSPNADSFGNDTTSRSKSSSAGEQFRIFLRALREKDILIILTWGALVYAVWSMVTSSTTTVLLHEFPGLTPIQLGLCFLPNGIGCVLGSIVTGKMMDFNYKQVIKLYKRKKGIAPEASVKGHQDIPYERARLSSLPYLTIVFIVSLCLYGSSYELNDVNRHAVANLIISLLLQFFIAYTATATFCINSALLVDCFPSSAAGATALNNLARCTVGAIGVSVIQPMIAALKIRNTFLLLGGIVTLFSPLVWVEWKYGQRWRMQREDLLRTPTSVVMSPVGK